MTCPTRSLVPGLAWRPGGWGRGVTAALLLCLHPGVSRADPGMNVIDGLPQQVIPLASEVGMGDFVFVPGSVTLLGGSSSEAGSGSDPGTVNRVVQGAGRTLEADVHHPETGARMTGADLPSSGPP